jgi:predicted dehydrogenase
LAAKAAIERGVLGRLVELECHFDYFRESDVVHTGEAINGSVYGHAVHLIDRAVATFGRPKQVFCDVKNVRTGIGLDDYHDIHLFYDNGFKVIVRAHYLVAIPFPQFIIHGSRGSFIKYGIDQQETDLKAGMSPADPGFGADNTRNYAQMKYLNQNDEWIEREMPTPLGDYGRLYDAAYETIINGAPKLISDDEMMTVMEILEGCFAGAGPHVFSL